MTLIAALTDKHGGGDFFAIADSLVSTEEFVPADPGFLPNQFGLDMGGETYGKKLESKIVLVGDALFMWAGRKVFAYSAIQRCKDFGRYNKSGFINVIESFEEQEAKEFSLIYFHFDGEILQGTSWNTDITNIGSTEIVCAGDGSQDFVDFEGDFSCDLSKNNLMDIVVNRFAKCLHAELTSDIHRYFRYGGAFEIIGISEIGGGFRRIPYNILEISNVDHTNGEILSLLRPTRYIHSIALRDRSRIVAFLLNENNNIETDHFLLSDVRSFGSGRFSPTDALENNLDVEIYFCYVISQVGMSWAASTTEAYSWMESSNDKKDIVIKKDMYLINERVGNTWIN